MVTKALITTLLRCLFLLSNPSRMEGGFILPTTVLLILVVTLAVGSMTLRTLNRTSQVMGDREQRIIYNAATPTMDRAKAKLEFLFDPIKNEFYPNGIPDQDELKDMMLYDSNYALSFSGCDGQRKDPYTFPDLACSYTSAGAETRIDIDGDNVDDNAWTYRIDLDEDGLLDATVAYSIIFNKPSNSDVNKLENSSDSAISERARVLQVRHGPLSVPVKDETCTSGNVGNNEEEEDGWSKPNQGGASLYKNFQVNAFVLPDNPATTVATLEFHQDRKIDEGNKWGAWFRNDLEVFPGSAFNWNGAMHTEGNLLVGNTYFKGFLISSPASCYYSREDSEITVADRKAGIEQDNNFQGQIMTGDLTYNDWETGNENDGEAHSYFHLFTEDGFENNGDLSAQYQKKKDATNDSVIDEKTPSDFLLDPVVLLTQDTSKARGFTSATATEDGNPALDRNDTWKTSEFVKEKRLYNKTEKTPSVDDSFRADNRYGPKPRVDGKTIPENSGSGENITGGIGEKITGNQMSAAGVTDDDMTRLGPPSGDEADNFNNVGLDGYWERRARAEGARIIVGQRLELGNTFGWGGGVDANGDYFDADSSDGFEQEPLMPWDNCDEEENTNNSGRCGEARQRRTLRDNLAAVQSTAVYHASATGIDNDFPVACLASVSHPGTAYTLQNSSTFLDWTQGLEGYWDSAELPEWFISDFFRGEGTNGWEYETPSGGSPTTFANDLADTQPLGKALRNLAYFAGDPFAGAPSFKPVQDNLVHPYPILSMWGDFSILRRIFEDELDNGNGTSYANLSPADKTTLQTAACSLGMLANEVYNLENFQYNLAPSDTKYGTSDHTLLDVLNARLVALMLDKDAYANQAAYDTDVLLELDAGTLPDYWREPPVQQDTAPYDAFYEGRTTFNDNDGNSATEGFDGLGNVADPEAYIARLQQWKEVDQLAIDQNKLTTFNVDDDLINLAKIIMLREQTIRDRSWGFEIDETLTYSPNCMSGPFVSNPAFQSDAYGTILDTLRENVNVGLSLLCTDQPKFGALYSIFPGDNIQGTNDQIDGDDEHGEDVDRSRGLPNSENRLTKIQGSAFNGEFQYQALTADDLDSIRLEPRTPSDWKLPTGAMGTASDNKVSPLSNRKNSTLMVTCNLELCSGTPSNGANGRLYQTQTLEVGLKDTGIYNGRELMNVRVMDLDLDLLRQDSTGLGNDPKGNADVWLPNSGIIYAFREDAIREDAITRDSLASWSECATDAAFVSGTNTRCHMGNVEGNAEETKDPPLYDKNSISPKPVDYYADPDRRPNGFRLRNGAILNRPNDQGKGLSLISDNAVYIKGNFNLHQDANGNTLEEFKPADHLADNFANFYMRDQLDPDFASITTDEWRPSEILADAISILSDNFCDGSIFDAYQSTNTRINNIRLSDQENNRRDATNAPLPWRSLYNCESVANSKTQSSYTNGYFPRVQLTNNTHQLNQQGSKSGFTEYWHHENPFDTKSPYAITRQGNPRTPQNANPYVGLYWPIGSYQEAKRPNPANEISVNSIIISGIVPSRPWQTYGGLHNFPRFLENWKNQDLRISGSLMQLNFSHTSTGPYDHDAWEVEDLAQPLAGDGLNQLIRYYSAPGRLWGYDVGLQKGVAGPLAKRFVSGAEPTRSEFYSEPPADDPYIYNLCQAIATGCYRDPPIN